MEASWVAGKLVLEFVKDDTLTDEEMAFLGELRHVLTLSGTESDAVMEEAVSARYGRGLKEVVADAKVTSEEKAKLERLSSGLRLSDETRDRLTKLHVQEFAQSQAKVIGADERAGLEELQELDQLGAALGVEIELDSATTATLARYHHLWLIENGQPRTIQVDIALQKGEEAYFATVVRWAELRTKTVRVTYSGTTASIRIMKGVRWRVGTITPHRTTEEQLTVVDSGHLYITNKRVIFRGSTKNAALPLKSLLGIRVYSDGIQFEKATGRSPYALFDGDMSLRRCS